MTRHDLEQVIIDVVIDVQQKSGRLPTAIDRDICPVGGLPEFDSLLSLEATVELESRLGFTTDASVFINEGGTRALRIREVAQRVQEISHIEVTG
jgi:hypothetical protein